MSAAAVVSHPITILPPGPERKELTSEFFDRGHTYARQPVSAQVNGEGAFESPGIDFSDYGRMYSFDQKLEAHRRLDTPAWALRADLTRAVIVHYVERRANIHKPQPGTEKERLARASQKNAERCKFKEAVLRNLCAEFVELNKSGANPARAKRLAQEIANVDTCLRIDRNIAGIALRCVHLYYSVGLDSVATATELGLKPTHVRALIWKLNWVWDKLRGVAKPRDRRKNNNNAKSIARMAAAGTSYTIIGERVGKSRAQIYYLLKKAEQWQPRRIFVKPTVSRAPRQKGRSPYVEHQQFNADIAIGLYLAGKSVPEIARSFGYAPRTGQNRTRAVLIAAGVYKSKS